MSSLSPDQDRPRPLARARAHRLPDRPGVGRIFVRGEGVWLWDDAGRRYLDFAANPSGAVLGHASPRLVAALREQADRLGLLGEPRIGEPELELMDRLVDWTFADRIGLVPSATDARRGAVTLLRAAARRAGRDEATTLVAPAPEARAPPFPAEGDVAPRHAVPWGDADAVAAALDELGPRALGVYTPAAVLAAGAESAPAGYLRRLRRICDERGLGLVVDEAATSPAWTGEWLACEIDDVRPDVGVLGPSLAAGVPMGALLVREETSAAAGPGAPDTGAGGAPLAARAALEVARAVEDETLLDRAFETGEHLAGALEGLAERHPHRLGAVRGLGVLRGVELRGGDPAALAEAALSRGLLVGAEADLLRMTPPPMATTAHVDAAVELLEHALEEGGADDAAS